MTQEKFDPIYEALTKLNSLRQHISDNIVQEAQEGQSNHFDNLPKAEQIAIIEIYNNVVQTIGSIDRYEHWFMNN